MVSGETLIAGNDNGSLAHHLKKELHRPCSDQNSLLSRSAELEALTRWKEAAQQSPYKPFFDLAESVTSLNRLNVNESTRDQIEARLSHALTVRGNKLGPFTADFYLALVDCAFETPAMPRLELNRQKIVVLADKGFLNVLFDPKVGFDEKLDVFYGQLAGYFEGLEELDVLASHASEGDSGYDRKLRNDRVDGVDAFTPKIEEIDPEGESVILWEISTSGKHGYYAVKTYDVWKPLEAMWIRDPDRYVALEGVEHPHTPRHYILGKLGTDLHYIPVLSGYAAFKYTRKSIGNNDTHDDAYDDGYDLLRDSCGNYAACAHSAEQEVVIYMSPTVSTRPPVADIPAINFDFQDDTVLLLQEASKLNGSLAQASALARFVMSRFTYSNDSSLNEIYRNYPFGFLSAVEKYRLVDCDVANTYFAALCSQLGISNQLVTGFFSHRYKDLETAIITAADAHAWLKVWDDVSMKWVILDATPPGAFDPTVTTVIPDKNLFDAFTDGDFLLKECDLQEVLRELKRQERNFAGLPEYSLQEVRFSESAGVSLWEARRILEESREVEKTMASDGRTRVTDALSSFWNLIAIEVTSGIQFDQTLRSKKGGGEEIRDIVAHYVGLLSSDYDPQTRNYPSEAPYDDKLPGGFDVFLCLDRSGSMSGTDGGKHLLAQRDASYLLFRSLSNFASQLERGGIQSLPIRTMAISFDRDDSIVVDKPLSPDLSDREIARMWRSLGIRGSGNADIPLLEHILNLIRAEKTTSKKQSGTHPDSMKIILVFSDGMPAGYNELTEVVSKLGEEGAVVVGIGLGEMAGTIPLIFDTPYSTGVIAESPADYVSIVARVVMERVMELVSADTQSRVQLESLIERFNC